jgi:predicted GTPase
MGLESCTNEVQTSQSFPLDEKNVVLVDTPGFDDTTKSDTDVLKMIAAYLQTMFVPSDHLGNLAH